MYEETEDGFRPDGNYDIHGTPEGYKDGKYGRWFGKDDFQPYKTNKELREESRKRWGLDDDEAENTPKISRPSAYDNAVDDISNSVENSISDGVSGIFSSILFFLASIVGFTAVGTFVSECKGDSFNLDKALKKTGRNVGCIIGIIFSVIAILVIDVIFAVLDAGRIGTVICIILDLCLFYIFIGLIRVMMNKTFFIPIKKHLKSVRMPKVKKGTYVIVEIISIIVFIKPILFFLDETVAGWIAVPLENLSNAELLTGIVILLLGSALLAALPGLIICLFIRLFFGRK